MMGIGTQEVILVMIAALLIFGPKKLPEIGKSLGSAMRELRRASNEFIAGIENDEPDYSQSGRRRLDDIRANTEPTDSEDEFRKQVNS